MTSRPWPASIDSARRRTRGSDARSGASSARSRAWLWWATIIERYVASATFQSASSGGAETGAMPGIAAVRARAAGLLDVALGARRGPSVV